MSASLIAVRSVVELNGVFYRIDSHDRETDSYWTTRVRKDGKPEYTFRSRRSWFNGRNLRDKATIVS